MIFYAVALLFFLQLLTSFVAANYALGLLHNELPAESASALLLLSPLLLTVRHRLRSSLVAGLFVAVAVARLTLPFIGDARAIVLVSGLGVSASMLLLPFLLWSHRGSDLPSALEGGLALAVAALIALRAVGSGVDVSMSGQGQVIAWPVALLAFRQWPARGALPPQEEDAANGFRVTVLCLGVIAALLLIYLAFSAPNVIAGWTGASYLIVLALVTGALVFWSALSPMRSGATGRPSRVAGITLLGMLLAVTALGHQVSFPAAAAAYPLPAPAAPEWSTPALMATLALWPITLLAVYVLARQLLELQPSLRQLGWGFGLGAVLLAAVIFTQILTTTYDYVPVIGPVFRDRFWLVLALPAVVLLAALLAISPAAPRAVPPRPLLTGALAAMALLAIGGAVYVRADPKFPAPDGTLTILTYNVQQGYSADLRRNFDGQLALLREYDADVIGLSESDTNRVAGGNEDLVRYFADKLDMHSYFGPKTVNGSFGIALLSRYPIEEPKTFYLYSEGEQTAMIAARVTVEGTTFDVLVTHLGNDGPLVQQQAVLKVATGRSNVILMGDFNFRPETEQYRLTARQLEDAWAKRWPTGVEANGSAWPRRIDHIFVSPGIEVRDATFIDSPESDHPALLVTVTR